LQERLVCARPRGWKRSGRRRRAVSQVARQRAPSSAARSRSPCAQGRRERYHTPAGQTRCDTSLRAPSVRARPDGSLRTPARGAIAPAPQIRPLGRARAAADSTGAAARASLLASPCRKNGARAATHSLPASRPGRLAKMAAIAPPSTESRSAAAPSVASPVAAATASGSAVAAAGDPAASAPPRKRRSLPVRQSLSLQLQKLRDEAKVSDEPPDVCPQVGRASISLHPPICVPVGTRARRPS
jgi:hypothetical protein